MIGNVSGKTPNGGTNLPTQIGTVTVSREPFMFEIYGLREAMDAERKLMWEKLRFTEGADSFGECVW